MRSNASGEALRRQQFTNDHDITKKATNIYIYLSFQKWNIMIEKNRDLEL